MWCFPPVFAHNAPCCPLIPLAIETMAKNGKKNKAGGRPRDVPLATLLQLARGDQRAELGRLVAEGGISNINGADGTGWTALQMACYEGHS